MAHGVRMLTRITAGTLLLAIFGIIWISDGVEGANVTAGTGSTAGQISVSQVGLSSPTAIANESGYGNFLRTVQSMYREDFNYSGGILENYVNKSISDSDAMVATTSIFILTSHSIALLETNTPPKAYENAYNDTLNGMVSLRAFLWNMSKFYETKKNGYLVQARKNLNESVSYYKTGQEGLASLKP